MVVLTDFLAVVLLLYRLGLQVDLSDPQETRRGSPLLNRAIVEFVFFSLLLRLSLFIPYNLAKVLKPSQGSFNIISVCSSLRPSSYRDGKPHRFDFSLPV